MDDAYSPVGPTASFARAWAFDAPQTHRRLSELFEPCTTRPLKRIAGEHGERLAALVDGVARDGVGDMLADGVEDPSYGAPHRWGRRTAKDGTPEFLLGSAEAEISSVMTAILAARAVAFQVEAVIASGDPSETAERQLAAILRVGEPIRIRGQGLAGSLASGKSTAPDRREEHLRRWGTWLTHPSHPSEKHRAPRLRSRSAPLACEICGARPARRVVSRRHVSVIVIARFIKTDIVCCRPHAFGLLLPALRKSLWQGWWGAGLFGINLFVVGADLAWLARTLTLRSAGPGTTQTSAYIQRELRMTGSAIDTRHRTVVFVEPAASRRTIDA